MRQVYDSANNPTPHRWHVTGKQQRKGKTMKAYHGTTRENAENILNGGTKETATWYCSDDEYLYLWCPDALIEGGECEEYEEAEEMAIRNAFESAQITAAVSNEPQKELVVLCFDFPEGIIEADDSCEHMELARRVEDFDGIEKGHIKTLTCKHNSRLDALVVSSLLDNPNITYIDDDLREAAIAMRDVYVDSLYDFDYSEE
jgi:hypothetical protein